VSAPPVSWRALVTTFAQIGALSFGGPAGQIALLHRMLVDDRQWLDDATFSRGLNLCMLLPGPEAQQLATYCGWRLKGAAGGLVAGALFILPGALLMLALAIAYVTVGETPVAQGLLTGLKAAVVAIIAQAILRIARKTLTAPWAWGVAAFAFLAVTLKLAPFPLVIALAALIGAWRAAPQPSVTMAPAPPFAWRLALGGTLLWLAPLAALGGALGWDHRLAELGRFCAQLALVSFGGAYALLAYVKDVVVTSFGWVTPTDLIAGLGLAETTPGPLILVVQFIGFLAGYNAAAPFDPIGAGVLASLVVLWMLFGPSFLFILLLSPQVDRLAGRPRLSAALTGITAAVVGVIASVALWFTLHLLFVAVGQAPLLWGSLPAPSWGAMDVRAGLLALFALVALFGFQLKVWQVLGLAAAMGLAFELMF
jgi:chromate transporter